jgi:phage terminase small subunit
MRWRNLSVLLAFTSIACSQGDVEQARQSTQSWIATIHLVKLERADRRVTEKYVQQTTEAAKKSLDQIKPEMRQQIQPLVDQLNKEISRTDAPTTAGQS